MALQICLKAALRSKYESLDEAFSKSSILPSRLCYQEVKYNSIEPDFYQHEYRRLDRSSFFPDASLTDVLSCKCQHKNRKRTVMTLGVSGVGKTTMVQSCALDWARDKGYRNISFLFPLTFWELNLLKHRLSLTELLQTFYPELKELDASVLNEDGVWFILDGLDEFKIQLNFDCPAVSDVSEATTVDSLVTNLIRGNLLPRAHIWVTSRISAASQIPPCYLLKKTELLGFSDEQKEQHFRMVIGDDDDLANKAINHVRISKSLDSLCQIPLICTIMASVLKDHVKGQKGFKVHPLTLTELYTLGFGALEVEHLAIVAKLKNLALLRMGAQNVMYEGDLSGYGISVEEALAFAETCPLVLRMETGLYGTAVFRFGHLSVQEFLAASHKLEVTKACKEDLSSCILGQVDEVLENNEGISDLLLRFMFGLIKERMLLPPNDLLFAYVKEKILSKTSYSTVILFHCLREYDSRALQEEVRFFQSYGISQIGFSLTHWNDLMQMIRDFEGIQESFEMEVSVRCDEKLIRNIAAIFKSRKATLKFSNLTDKSCPALAAVLSSRESFLRELDLGYNSFSTSGVQELAEGLNSMNCRLKILRLQGCGLTAETCQYLKQCLIQHQRLQELDLSSNEIGDQGLKLLSEALGTSSCRLHTLKLSQCDIEESGCYHLGSALHRNPDCLSVLDLSINMIGDKGANEIFKNFDISLLKKLELYHCGLTMLSCDSIGEALKSETSTLLELSLSNNSLKDDGFKPICEGMYAWCSLQKLNVSRCGITGTGCRYLATVLCSVSQLTDGWMGTGEWQAVELRHLDLSMNPIGDKGVKEISPGLMNPLSHLKTLNLSYCSLTDSCCAELASGLMSANVLSGLDLSHNNLQDKGVKKLCVGLQHPQCILEKLLLRTCDLTSKSVQFLTSALQFNPLHLTELHLMGNKLEDSDIRALVELTTNRKYALRAIDVSVD